MTGPLILIALLALGPQSGPPPCSDPRHRQFDFWIGDWEVSDAAGVRQGRNRIERIEGGCAIQEVWTGANGTTGRSLNAFRPATGQWHQTWVSNGGAVLLLDGAFDGKRMVLSGPSVDPAGRPVQNRITWTPLPDGRVRQLWEQAARDGGEWRVVFDGYYTRAGKQGL